MGYSNYTEVIERYPMMSSWGDIQSHVSSLVWFAEKQLDGMLATAYSVPFDPVPPVVKDLTIDITYYKALVTRDPEKASKIEDYIMGRIERIIKGKEKILSGSGTTLEVTSALQKVWSNIGCFHPVHSMLDPQHADVQVSSMRHSYEVDEREE